jgi:hypothetical protein
MKGESAGPGSRRNNEDNKRDGRGRERQTRLANRAIAMRDSAMQDRCFLRPNLVERLPAVSWNPLRGGERAT